jgi:hypothetical protein
VFHHTSASWSVPRPNICASLSCTLFPITPSTIGTEPNHTTSSISSDPETSLLRLPRGKRRINIARSNSIGSVSALTTPVLTNNLPFSSVLVYCLAPLLLRPYVGPRLTDVFHLLLSRSTNLVASNSVCLLRKSEPPVSQVVSIIC